MVIREMQPLTVTVTLAPSVPLPLLLSPLLTAACRSLVISDVTASNIQRKCLREAVTARLRP